MADIELENLIAIEKAKLVPGQRVIKIGQNIFLPIGIGGKNPPEKPSNQPYSGKEEKMLKTGNLAYSFGGGYHSIQNDAGIEMKVEPYQTYWEGSYSGSEKNMVDKDDLDAQYLVLRGCANANINGDYVLVDDSAVGNNRVWTNGTYYICRSGDTGGWCITTNSSNNTKATYSLFTVVNTENPYSNTGSLGWGSIDWNNGSFMNNRKLLLFTNGFTSTIEVEAQSMKTSAMVLKNKTIVTLSGVTFTKVNEGFAVAGYVYNSDGYTGPLLVGRTSSVVEVKDSTSNSVANTPSVFYYSPSARLVTTTEPQTSGYETFYWNGGTTNWVSGNQNSSSSNFANVNKLTDSSTIVEALKELMDMYYDNFVSFPALEEFNTRERYLVSGAGTSAVNGNNYYVSFDGDENYPTFLENMYAVNYCFATRTHYLCGYITQSLMQMHVIVPLNWTGATAPLYYSFDNVINPEEVVNWYAGSGSSPVPTVNWNNTPNILGVNGDVVSPAGLNATYTLVDPEQIGTSRKWTDETQTYYITYTSSDNKWVISTIANPTTIADGLFYINEANVVDPFIDAENSKTWTVVDANAVTINGDLTVVTGEATPPYNEFTITDTPSGEVNGYYRSVNLEEDTTLYNQMINVWNNWWGGTLSVYYAFAKVENGDMICFAFNNDIIVFIRKEYLNNGWWDSFHAYGGNGDDWNIMPRSFEEYWNWGGRYTFNRSWLKEM